jgi:hypothetical protein
MFILSCSNNCNQKIKSIIDELATKGKGEFDLGNFNCFQWNKMIVVEPYFNVNELKEVTDDSIPSEMLHRQMSEENYHLLFLNSREIVGYVLVSNNSISLSNLVIGKKCYSLFYKKGLKMKIFTTNEKFYNMNKNIIRAQLINN